MKREYSSGESDQVVFFTGIEVEKTPVYGAKTLFVVGLQDFETIKEKAIVEHCNHIYLGANHSYFESPAWDDLILRLTKEQFMVSLDFDVKHTEYLLEGVLGDFNPLLIPIISVKIPYLSQFNYNTVVKIDDKDFNATNEGVWSHMLHDLKDRSKFTPWVDYTKDEPVDD